MVLRLLPATSNFLLVYTDLLKKSLSHCFFFLLFFIVFDISSSSVSELVFCDRYINRFELLYLICMFEWWLRVTGTIYVT